MVIASDPELASLAGAPVVDRPDADLILAASWDSARRWRDRGARGPIAVRAEGESPEDRALLEPVAVLRASTPEGLAAAVARCRDGRASNALAGGDFEPERRRFRRRDGVEVELTPLETRLLAYLTSRPTRPIERDELQEEVWDYRRALDTKAVDVAVARLRKKIEPDPAAPVSILTVRGGYRAIVPAPAAALLGRESLVNEVVARLGTRGTHVALVGTPGVGKSRAAAEVARRLGAMGVPIRMVDLDTLPADVEPGVALATALDLEVAPSGDALRAVVDAVADGLLVLDHAEQRPAVAAALLSAASGRCTVLVASQVVPSPGIEVRLVPPLGEDDGAELLVRATGGAIDRDDARRLIPLLDGLPLAITLAASRIALLGPEEFLAAMNERLALLSPPGADRHGSLGAAVRDAVDRLDPVERAALHALLVFRGPFRVVDGAAILGPDAAVRIADLVARGVLARDGSRYRILHAIRDHLAAVPEEAAHRHVGWAVDRVRGLLPLLEGAGARAAFGELTALHADLRAALERASDLRDLATLVTGIDTVLAVTSTEAERVALLDRFETVADPVARATIQVRRAMSLVGRETSRAIAEARHAADALLEHDPRASARATVLAAKLAWRADPRAALGWVLSPDPAPLDRATRRMLRALASGCRHYLGELSLADAIAELSAAMDDLADAGALGDATWVGLNLVPLVRNTAPERCLAILERLVAWSDTLRDPATTAAVHNTLGGEYALAGRPDDARRELDAADALFARVQPGARQRVAQRRAWIDMHAGASREARAGYEAVLDRARLQGEAAIIVEVLIDLALVEADAGRPAAALARAEEGTALCRRMDRPDFLAHATLALGLSHLLCRNVEAAQAALRDVDRSHLAPRSWIAWLTTSVVVEALLDRGAPGLDAELDAFVAESTSPDAAIVQRITAAGRAGDRGVLEAEMTPATGRGVDTRLLARVWVSRN